MAISDAHEEYMPREEEEEEETNNSQYYRKPFQLQLSFSQADLFFPHVLFPFLFPLVLFLST